MSDSVLVHQAHTKHKLAVVCVEHVREDAVEKARPQAIHVEEKLPSFVAACEFLRDVAWGAIKRTREEVQGVAYSLAMPMPGGAFSEDCPGPRSLIIWTSAVYCAALERNHQVR